MDGGRGGPGKADVAGLKRQVDTYAALAFCWADAVFKLAPDLTIEFASGATDLLAGYSGGDLKGHAMLDIVAPSDGNIFAELFDKARRRGRVDRTPLNLRGPGGHLMAMSLAGYMPDPEDGSLYLALRKMTPEERLAAQGYKRKGSTGLFESEAFAEIAAHRVQEAREAGEDTELSLITLPGLDSLGSRMSGSRRQALMQQIGEELRASSYGGDTAAFVGQGRYSVLHKAGENLEAIRTSLAELTRQADPQGRGTEVQCVGVALGGSRGIGEQDLARGLMYTLNQFAHSQADTFSLDGLSRNMTELVDAAIKEVDSFKSIVAQGSFHVALHPIVDVRTGATHHFEALCRFDQAAPGESPFRHLQFAEETGMIHEFDLAMVEKVIDWLRQRPAHNPSARVAVNVSGHSVGMDSYIAGLNRLLDANAWTRGRLLFEITESARMSDLRGANRFIQGLRKRGYQVCLDDFGAGAASFQYLSALEVDVVKLDGSAVRNARKAEKGRAFLSALTELCRRLGTKTIAEMIDDAEGLQFARQCGVDYVQGFLFGRPSHNIGDFSPLPNATLFQGTRLRRHQSDFSQHR